VLNNSELMQGIIDYPDEYIYREDQIKKLLGILCWHKGCFAHEIFEDPEWTKNILFDLSVANSFYKDYIDAIKSK
jgi:hypothetical protein